MDGLINGIDLNKNKSLNSVKLLAAEMANAFKETFNASVGDLEGLHPNEGKGNNNNLSPFSQMQSQNAYNNQVPFMSGYSYNNQSTSNTNDNSRTINLYGNTTNAHLNYINSISRG